MLSHNPNTANSSVSGTNWFTLIEDESIPLNAKHWELEHFIPVARADWRLLITEYAVKGGQDHDTFEEFCALVDTLMHMLEYHDNASTSENYAHVDPDKLGDRITKSTASSDADAQCKLVQKQLDGIMLRGNYQKLDRQALLLALSESSEFGMPMKSDFAVFKRISVYVRGKIFGTQTRRRLRNFYRKEEVSVPLFQRLVICFQLTEDAADGDDHRSDCLYIKSFKNIPQHDIDMLLPGTSVKMSLLDQGKIALPTLSGLAMLTFRIVAVASLGLFAFIGLLFTTSGYAVKSIFGYIRTKDRYQHNLTKNLYYQNLGNNAGVLQQLQNEAEIQDIQECLLAYSILLIQFPDGATLGQLDKAAEAFIQDIVGFSVNFEVDDALRKLAKLKLLIVENKRLYKAVSLTDAQSILQEGFMHRFLAYNRD